MELSSSTGPSAPRADSGTDLSPRAVGDRAIGAAARWARRFLIGRRTFTSSILDTEVETLETFRTRFRGTRRRVVERLAPTRSRRRNLDQPLGFEEIDPWTEDPDGLAERSRQIVLCSACGGSKKARCEGCSGLAATACSACRATGRTRSPKTGRIVSCRSCRGSGQRRCPCRDGTIACPTCEGRGKVERWLEIEANPFDLAILDSEHELARTLAEGGGSSGSPKILPIATWAGKTLDQAPPQLVQVVHHEALRVQLSDLHDRLDRLEVEQYRSPVTLVRYRLAGRTGELRVCDWDGSVRETSTARAPLRRRLATLALVAGVTLVSAFFLAFAYRGRHPFFATTPVSSLLVLLAPVLALATLPPVARLCVSRFGAGGRSEAVEGRGRPRSTSRLLDLLPLLLALAAAPGLWTLGAPSLDHARILADQGEIERALIEADACVRVHCASDAADTHDRIRLERVLAASTPEESWPWIVGTFHRAEARDEAKSHGIALLIERARELRQRAVARRADAGPDGSSAKRALSESRELEALIELVPSTLRTDTRLRPVRRAWFQERAEACVDQLDATCARAVVADLRRDGFAPDTLEPVHQRALTKLDPVLRQQWATTGSTEPIGLRVDTCGRMGSSAEILSALEVPGDRWPIGPDRIARRCRDLAERQQRERVLEIQAMARAREAERLREEREREASRRRWASAPLRCRDGTLSPTCVCGGSRRGCCSHHGGVAGCSG